MNKNKEEKFIDILKLVAPGTEIRQGLENILKSKKLFIEVFITEFIF